MGKPENQVSAQILVSEECLIRHEQDRTCPEDATQHFKAIFLSPCPFVLLSFCLIRLIVGLISPIDGLIGGLICLIGGHPVIQRT